MLILARRPGEEIMIGDEVRIVVHQIVGGQVRIGITAPRDVPVHRREIYDRILDEREQKAWKA